MLLQDDDLPLMKHVDVAIGIIVRSGKFLICQRRAEGALAGFWEFPGGKQEPAEAIEQALARELKEELGIEVRTIEAMPPIEFDYSSMLIRLHSFPGGQ
jgi:8-oxo-dGTP diphosphatase